MKDFDIIKRLQEGADDILQPHSKEEQAKREESARQRKQDFINQYNGEAVYQIAQIERAPYFDFVEEYQLTGVVGFTEELGEIVLYVEVDDPVDELDEWDNKIYYEIEEEDLMEAFLEEWSLDMPTNESKADNILQPHSEDVIKQKQADAEKLVKSWSDDLKKGYPKLRRTMEEYAKRHIDDNLTVGQMQSVLYRLGCSLLPNMDQFTKHGLNYSLGKIGQVAYGVANSMGLPIYPSSNEAKSDDILQPHEPEVAKQRAEQRQEQVDAALKHYFAHSTMSLTAALERYVNTPEFMRAKGDTSTLRALYYKAKDILDFDNIVIADDAVDDDEWNRLVGLVMDIADKVASRVIYINNVPKLMGE